MASKKDQQSHVEAWWASGISQAAYCREHGLNAKTFGNWLRVYRIERKEVHSSALIPVTIRPVAPSLDALKLRCPGGHALELPANVSPRWLGELLKCLG